MTWRRSWIGDGLAATVPISMTAQTRHAATGRVRAARDGSIPGTLMVKATIAAAKTTVSVAVARATNQPFTIWWIDVLAGA